MQGILNEIFYTFVVNYLSLEWIFFSHYSFSQILFNELLYFNNLVRVDSVILQNIFIYLIFFLHFTFDPSLNLYN